MSRWLVPVLAVLLGSAVLAAGSVPVGDIALAQSTPDAGLLATPAGGEEAAPTADEGFRFTRELLGQARVADAAGEPQFVTLTRVSLAPDLTATKDAPMAPHPHAGPSVLFVESGIVCYEASAPGGGAATLTAMTGPTPLPEGYAEAVGCERPVATGDVPCDIGCEVSTTGALLLVAGESIAHSEAVNHRYWAPGRDGAVVYVSELQARGDERGCSGGCH